MLRAVRFVLLGACAVSWSHAAQFLVVTRGADNSWSFQAVDAVQVNGKDKVRGAALGSADSWDARAIGHLPECRLADFVVVRRLGDGALAGRSAENEWRLLLPESVKSKTTDTAGHLWGETALELKKDRKDKTPDALRIEVLYAIVPGQDPAASVAELATDLLCTKPQACPTRTRSVPCSR